MSEEKAENFLRVSPAIKYPSKESIELCSAIAHEVNRAYCASMNEHHPPWEKAPQWQVDSVIAGVQALLDNPNLTPAESHALWMERKFKEGWTLGILTDGEKKTHPCLMPYEMLSPYQCAKDVLFGAVVRTFFGL